MNITGYDVVYDGQVYHCRAAPSWYEIVLTGVVSALAANKLYKLSTREEDDT